MSEQRAPYTVPPRPRNELATAYVLAQAIHHSAHVLQAEFDRLSRPAHVQISALDCAELLGLVGCIQDTIDGLLAEIQDQRVSVITGDNAAERSLAALKHLAASLQQFAGGH